MCYYVLHMKPRLIVEQKITAFVNKYAIYTATEDGHKDQLVALAQQKRIALKEKITFYTDESKQEIAFSFRAEKVMDIHGRYLVEDAQGHLIGAFRKDFKKSLLSSTWNIIDAGDKTTLNVTESSIALAVIRRYGGFIPIAGDIINLITSFLRYHFIFFDAETGREVGRYQKTTLFRDHYKLLAEDEAYTKQDWRVLAAMAVGLDALQSR